ncbi:hypothetical protein ACJMK2_044033 [Sinanodonta woodiana]|uniref:Filaggrin-2-like n=1 Tax=Sinanodonta woodiana TaxID=1069815 RepID=A0ABD3VYT2_SINWO
MAAYYCPVIVCIIFAMGSVAQEGHTGHVIRGEHRGHGGQVIRKKISNTVDVSIARATDPFGVSQERRSSTHGSHATHGEHGGHGAQTGHEGHGIIGGSHGVQGHSSHGSDAKAGHGNHGHQKSDHTEHRQTSARLDSAHGHGGTFKQIGHDINSGKHSDHKTVVQVVMKSHDLPVPKVKDGHSISEINAVSSHAGHTIPVSTAITEIGSHATHGEHGTHSTAIIGGSNDIQGHGSHGSNSDVGHDNHGIQKSDHTGHRQTNTHQESAHGRGSNFEQNGHGIDSGMHSDHKTIVQDVSKLHGQKTQAGQSISEINAVVSHAGHTIPTHTSIIKHDNANNMKRDHEIHVHESVGRQNINADNITHEHTLSSQGTQDLHDRHGDGHSMPFHDTTPGHHVDHNSHRVNVKPSIENENHLPRLNAHEIHSGRSMTTQSGSANPSRHIKIEGSETMAALEHNSRVSPSHDVHKVPTTKQSMNTMQVEHGGHIIPTLEHSDKLAIWGNSKELNHGVHTPDVQRISGTPSHLPSSLTQLPDKRIIQSPSNGSNQWHHSNIRHISPKPQVHEAHSSHANVNMKNSRLPSDDTGSGVHKKVAEHGDHRINDHLTNAMLMFNSVDPSAKDSTVNQHTGGHTMKNDTKRNHVDVLGARQSNTQQKVDFVIPRTLEFHQAQHKLRKENIHTVTGLLEGLNAKKEASSNVELIGHIDPVEMELHDHPVDAHASSLDGVLTVDSNLNVDRSRIHAESNVPNVNKGSGQNISIVHTTSQKSKMANSTASSLNLNNFLENINAELNNKGFGFVEPITSNSGVQNSIGQQRPSAVKRQDNHNIPAHTGSSFDAGTVSNLGQGQGNIFTGFKNNREMHDRNNRNQLPPTTPSPPIESTTVFVQQFSGEPTSMDSIFMRMFDPLTADMMLNRNVYPPVVDPFNDPRVPHNHGPMTSPVHNNGFSMFDFFVGEF